MHIFHIGAWGVPTLALPFTDGLVCGIPPQQRACAEAEACSARQDIFGFDQYCASWQCILACFLNTCHVHMVIEPSTKVTHKVRALDQFPIDSY